MPYDYGPLVRYARLFVLSGYSGLLVVLTINTLVWPSCNKNPNAVIWLIHLLPVLMFLPGILKRNVRTHVWLSFICMGYFLAAVPAATACVSILPIIETLLIIQLFTSAMLYIRWRSRELAAIDSLQTE